MSEPTRAERIEAIARRAWAAREAGFPPRLRMSWADGTPLAKARALVAAERELDRRERQAL